MWTKFWNSAFVRSASPTVEYVQDIANKVWKWLSRNIRPIRSYRKNLKQDIVSEHRKQLAYYRELNLLRLHGTAIRRSIARAELRLAFASVWRVRVERTVFVAVVIIMCSSFWVDGSKHHAKGGRAAWLVFDPIDYVFHLVKEDRVHLFASENEKRAAATTKSSGATGNATRAIVLQPGFSATLFVLVLMGFFFSRSRRSARWPIFGAIVVGVALLLTLIIRKAQVAEWSDPARTLVAYSAAAVSVAVLLFIVDVIGSGLSYGFLHWRRRMYPDAIVLDGLIKVLHRVVKSPERWPDLSFRREIASRIEEVALAIQYGFPGRLRITNPVMNTWVRDVAAEQAAAIRELQRWLLHPKSDTRDHFINSVRTTLERCASGDWDALERRTPEKLTPRQRGLRFADSVSALITAFIPIGILLAAREALGPEKIPDYLYVFAIVWTLGALVSRLDPLVAQRVAQQKDIFDLVKSVK